MAFDRGAGLVACGIIGDEMQPNASIGHGDVRYRQDAMPWAYWLALVLFGAVTILTIVSWAGSWLRGDRPPPTGPVLFGLVLGVLIWFYGPRRAYEIATDGNEVLWRSPMMATRVPLDRVTGIGVNRSPFTTAEPCLILDDGSRLVVAVSGKRQTHDFLVFANELAERNPDLSIDFPGS